MAQIRLAIRQLVEFLMQRGDIDSRFAGFDRANEGARIHRRLQKQAGEGYRAEVPLTLTRTVGGVEYTLEGRADGIFEEDGQTVIDEIKTTARPSAEITEEMNPCHWAQGMVYGAIYAGQQGLDTLSVRLTYFQIDEEKILRFTRRFTRGELEEFLDRLLADYAPWARRQLDWAAQRTGSLNALPFPYPAYRPGQRALAGEIYRACRQGRTEAKSGTRLFCQAPTGTGKTMSALFPALKALGEGHGDKLFYLTARTTARTAAEEAVAQLRRASPGLRLRSITLTAKEKVCLSKNEAGRPVCIPDLCPYAKGYFDRRKDALADLLDGPGSLDRPRIEEAARAHTVCPFELGLDASEWSDVVIGDYNYLFDPVVRLQRFFETRGDYLFLLDEAHNLPDRAREMHTAALAGSAFRDARRRLGKGRSRLKTALGRVCTHFTAWRRRCEEAAGDRSGKTVFAPDRDEEFDRLLTRLCDPLEGWLDEHREPDETHAALLQLYFDVRAWLRVADTFDDHFVLQLSAFGSEVRATQLCLDPSAFLQADFGRGRAAVLFSATLGPAAYYKDLCGLPDARAVALRSPFDPRRLALVCPRRISTRYRDRAASLEAVAGCLAAMVQARPGNYLAFFPSYAYLRQVYDVFTVANPGQETLCQTAEMDEAARAEFLARFAPDPAAPLLGFAVLGGVFGEGVDLAGDRLIGVAVVGPGLPQVGPRQEQLREYFEATRGSGFDYAYRYPGMNKVLQAAGRVIRTPADKGVVLLIDDRFTQSDYRRLMPPHWAGLRTVDTPAQLSALLAEFWGGEEETP